MCIMSVMYVPCFSIKNKNYSINIYQDSEGTVTVASRFNINLKK